MFIQTMTHDAREIVFGAHPFNVMQDVTGMSLPMQSVRKQTGGAR